MNLTRNKLKKLMKQKNQTRKKIKKTNSKNSNIKKQKRNTARRKRKLNLRKNTLKKKKGGAPLNPIEQNIITTESRKYADNNQPGPLQPAYKPTLLPVQTGKPSANLCAKMSDEWKKDAGCPESDAANDRYLQVSQPWMKGEQGYVVLREEDYEEAEPMEEAAAAAAEAATTAEAPVNAEAKTNSFVRRSDEREKKRIKRKRLREQKKAEEAAAAEAAAAEAAAAEAAAAEAAEALDAEALDAEALDAEALDAEAEAAEALDEEAETPLNESLVDLSEEPDNNEILYSPLAGAATTEAPVAGTPGGTQIGYESVLTQEAPPVAAQQQAPVAAQQQAPVAEAPVGAEATSGPQAATPLAATAEETPVAAAAPVGAEATSTPQAATPLAATAEETPLAAAEPVGAEATSGPQAATPLAATTEAPVAGTPGGTQIGYESVLTQEAPPVAEASVGAEATSGPVAGTPGGTLRRRPVKKEKNSKNNKQTVLQLEGNDMGESTTDDVQAPVAEAQVDAPKQEPNKKPGMKTITIRIDVPDCNHVDVRDDTGTTPEDSLKINFVEQHPDQNN